MSSKSYFQIIKALTWSFLFVFLYFPSFCIATDLDPPHDDAEDFTGGCLHCHQMTAYDQPNMIPPTGLSPQDIDDTPYNNVCWKCHDDDIAPFVLTHSSLSTESTRHGGNWTIQCSVCHNQHSQEQDDAYGTTYGGFIRTKIYLDKIFDNAPPMGVTVAGKSGYKNVKFIAATGPDSYAHTDGLGAGGTDSTPNGICQVCHEQTNHWKNDGSEGAVGVHANYNGENCMLCHNHAKGFRPDCNSCHGNPPVDSDSLVTYPYITGSATSGAHAVHATPGSSPNYLCETCHFNGMPETPVTGNDKIQMGFSGIAVTGADGTGTNYKGQTLAAEYSYEQTNGTTVSVDESLTCENLYCHSSVQGSADPTDPPVYKNPTWDDTFFLQVDTCNTRCHTAGGHIGTTKGTVLTTGSHERHLQFRFEQRSMCQACHYYAEFQIGGGDGCNNCHNRSSAHSSHVNQQINVNFNEEFPYLTTSTSGTYTGTLSPGDAYGSCSAIYCHSPGNKASAPYDTPNNTTVNWGGTLTGDCSDCHGGDKNSTTPLASGSHSKHITHPIDCSVCHQATAEDSRTYSSQLFETINPPKVYNYTTAQRYHSDGLITMVYDETIVGSDAEYDGRPQWLDLGVRREAGKAYGDCNNIYCHSIAQTSTGSPLTPDTTDYKEPTWGGASLSCSSCHSSSPPSGSHPKHIGVGQHCYNCHYSAFTPTQICTPCHNIHGPQFFATNTPLHVNYEVDVDMLANGLIDGTYNGSKNPADGFSTCDNTYCHSNGTSISTGTIPANSSPAWGTTGPLPCDSCHEYGPTYDLYDPKANSHVRHDFLGCEICHNGTTIDGSTIANNSLHANGEYNVSPSPTFFAHSSNHTNTFTYVFDTGGGTCSSITCHNYWGPAETKKWGGASLTPSSFNYNYVDQGDYGITITVGSPTCFPDPDSTTCPAPYTYKWDFSDGYTETTTSPSIHYEFGAAGPHTVTLTQTAANGLNGSRVSAPINPNPPPPPPPAWYPEATVVSGNTVELSITGSAFGKVYVRWDWNGSSTSQGSSSFTPPTTSIQKTYPGPGTYYIRVEVLDPGHIEYDYEWDTWPGTQTCDTCPSLKITVP